MNRKNKFIMVLFLIMNSNVLIPQENVVIQDSVASTIDTLVHPAPQYNHYRPHSEDNNSLWRQEEDTIYQSYEIPQATINKYRNSADFNYQERGTVRKPNLNWLDRFFNAISKIFERIFGFSISANIFNLLKWILIVSIGSFVAYHLLRFLGIRISFKKKRNQPLEEISFEEIEENLEEINFDRLIESAIKNQSYRVAIRLFFLKNLQTLSKRNYIEWQIDKTNNDYKYEVASTNLKDEFEATIYLFEHIWYGNFHLTNDGFQRALNRFRSFENSIGYAK